MPYKCLTNVLQMSYKYLTNVLQMSYKCLTNILQMSYKCYAVEYDEERLYHRLAAWVVIHPVFSENICNIWGHCNWATHFLSDPGKPGCFHIWIIDLKDVNLAVLHREHYVRKEEYTSQGHPSPLHSFLCLSDVNWADTGCFFFFTGTPPKSSKYKKVILGKVRCI